MQDKVKLPDHIIAMLTHLPESGLGYQNVTLTLTNGTILTKRKIVNSEFLLLHENERYLTNDFEKVELDEN
ncbi:MAG: hypothetical protein IIA45_03005 [Bacteroidetes bacterium]|nr:hypothetical protein [Bacteroidota bacterium]